MGIDPKVKGVGQAVGGDGPAFGRAGQGRAAVGVGREQAFAEGADDEELIGQRGELRVEGGGLVALADAQHVVRRRGGAFGAAR